MTLGQPPLSPAWTRAHTHTCTPAHTCDALRHKKPAEDPHWWASRLSPQGVGHLTLAPQEGGSLDFWDTQRGDPKPRRRRKSLKTFSLTPATFWGIWHWRVSALSLSGTVSTPAPAPAPLAPCSPSSEGGCHTPTPTSVQAPAQDTVAGLPRDSLFYHLSVQPPINPRSHSRASISSTPPMCQAPC